MTENKQKLECREDFMRGVTISRIAKEHNLSKGTIWIWADEGNWEEEREKLIEELKRKSDISIIEEKERSLKLIRATEAKYVEELKTSEGMPKSCPAFAQLQRVKWEILMPKSSYQYNFIKSEQTNNAYKIEIIAPKEDINSIQAKYDNDTDMQSVQTEKEEISLC
jgi:transposase-like protein